MSAARADVFVTAAELRQLIEAGDPVAVLDVRWTLAEPDGTAAYLAGHVPGAVYVSLDDELSDHGVVGRGRHPLPSGRDLEASARRWGLRNGVPVVVYDDWNRAGSGRAWWVLSAAGIPDVRILDGGLAAWTAAGGALQEGPVRPEPGDVVIAYDDLYHGARRTLTAEEAGTYPGVLLDARAPERFRGDVEPMDPAAGHIPGAVNLPSTRVLAADGTLLPDAELRGLLAEQGVGESAAVGAYCGSGVTAAVAVAALAAAGLDAALFPGSWSEWAGDPSRPVAVGP
ncbi:sulfurtransferase [Mycolicibacterium brisbanense]|uniref:Sulfurtransferase n=1 Tax=Mycolicibacterium brisbanense TaxID=146020 RepID=A0A124DZM4_9MYCO|nr:sulfurtransferase [Mycolicibacterium brisbanense]MCV7161267.1 sulfurtransferase [Mycolicibacterium brisbanense]GAS87828.1 thiosulfate sulfurtransferase sseB [Mycolicibacterium brisbanense]